MRGHEGTVHKLGQGLVIDSGELESIQCWKYCDLVLTLSSGILAGTLTACGGAVSLKQAASEMASSAGARIGPNFRAVSDFRLSAKLGRMNAEAKGVR